ncbi:MAG: SDR family NAD(P)-dependent oxidoreductase [Caldilineales bacterium]|nr:SDR family NAD(P)-dependent oxidoreductase [Caldilineales bacterium]MDW8319576.1 SDR family NAD(P)-dependent oxidoreductase [Anaerolineae bacterium]
MKTAMIWGAAGGIGQALLRRLRSDGWTTVAVARQSARLGSLADYAFDADVSKPHEVQQAVMAAGQEVDAVDLWVYTAGDITSAPVADMSPETWARILNANLTGAFLTAHYSLPLLAPDAHLFFLGAISERMRMPGLSAYAAAKAGLEAFGEALRKELRKQRVTVVRPAAVETPLWRKVPFKLPPGAMSPDALAERILAAYAEGHKGTLDLT